MELRFDAENRLPYIRIKKLTPLVDDTYSDLINNFIELAQQGIIFKKDCNDEKCSVHWKIIPDPKP